MKYKFKIAHRLILAFGILMVVMLFNAILTNYLVQKNRTINDKFNKVYEPSASLLESMVFMINNSKLLIKNWVHIDKIDGTADKIALQELHIKEYPSLRNKISKLVSNWTPEDQKAYQEIIFSIDTLFVMHKNIMTMLNKFSQYNDPMIVFEATILVEQDGDVIVMTDKVMGKLTKLLNRQKLVVENSNNEMVSSLNRMGIIVLIMTIILGISVLLIGYLTTRSIVRPMVYIQNITLDMAKGVLPKSVLRESYDEVGQMAKAINILVESFGKTSEFALQVGQGNFNSYFKALSEHDILGNSLLSMRSSLKEATDQLKRNEEILEQKVIERTAEVVKQKEIIENKNQQLTAGINYAKRIQEAMLPQPQFLNESLTDAFILFKPRDLVSGDFYWFRQINDLLVVAAVDCTGHGVPGGFMSMLGISLLNEITRKKTHIYTNEVLDEMRKQVKNSLGQTGKGHEQKDGMDIAICALDTKNSILQYAGANNPLLLIRNNNPGEITELRPDKMPIGIYVGEEKPFSNQQIQLEKGDKIYLFSDGYVDQFGGPKGRKFLASKFKELLLQICHRPMQEQKIILDQTIENWIFSPDAKGKQIDDILVIGFKI